eukprot:14120424-Ditylum_brightwellii.AAC.1
MGLKVELPMKLYIDNSGAVDLANNLIAGGRITHMETIMFFLRDLKEAGILHINWTSGEDNPVDMFTKNLAGPAFSKHSKVFVGEDKYNMQHNQLCKQGRVLEHNAQHSNCVPEVLIYVGSPYTSWGSYWSHVWSGDKLQNIAVPDYDIRK